ncbi:MAG: hypothetical protein KDC07_01470 [Chitinophagaceae bacterium]|nr:hypothetical protein [Chitinophagaceae bacterium]MCB9046186.1 hypothetical protein [Chitinophagales bacterium]
MKKALLPATLLLLTATLFSCKKPYTCTCEGGIVFQQYSKEIKAASSKKAREKCEGNNQPPNTPDVINCWLE